MSGPAGSEPRPMRAFELGYPGTDLRRRLLEAVLRGEKTATSSLRSEYLPHTSEPLPAAGDRLALAGVDGRPEGVVEVTEVAVVPAGKVDLDFARAEGEGFESVAAWRAARESFWSPVEISDATLIVCEWFRLVEGGPT